MELTDQHKVSPALTLGKLSPVPHLIGGTLQIRHNLEHFMENYNVVLSDQTQSETFYGKL